MANPGPTPDRAVLHEAALRHLARFAATEAGLVQVLDRRVGRWARQVGADAEAVAAARTAAREVARRLAATGVVDDAAFAAARAAKLSRSGRSRRAVTAHLAAKGVPQAVAAAALPDPAQELASALAYAKRRRLGPFRPTAADAELARRDLAALARAGFPQEVAERAMQLDAEAATAMLLAARRP